MHAYACARMLDKSNDKSTLFILYINECVPTMKCQAAQTNHFTYICATNDRIQQKNSPDEESCNSNKKGKWNTTESDLCIYYMRMKTSTNKSYSQFKRKKKKKLKNESTPWTNDTMNKNQNKAAHEQNKKPPKPKKAFNAEEEEETNSQIVFLPFGCRFIFNSGRS